MTTPLDDASFDRSRSFRLSRDGHISALDFDRLALGILSPQNGSALLAHVDTCAFCRAERQAGDEARIVFAKHIQPKQLSVVQGLARQKARWFALRYWAWAPALVLFAALGARWSSVRSGPQEPEPLGAGIQKKGGASLSIVAREGNDVFRVDGRRSLRRGSQIRFLLDADDLPYVLVASLDGEGRSTIYYPYDGAESAKVQNAGQWEVPGSIVLDSTSGPERVFALFSRKPLSASLVKEALGKRALVGVAGLRQDTPLNVAGEEQASVLLEKSP